MATPIPAYKGKGPYVFICYSHQDSKRVLDEIAFLNQAGFDCWYDQGISPGRSWSDELAEAIQGASLLLFFASPNAARSRHCAAEINFALDNNIPVLVAFLSATTLPKGLQLRLNAWQAIMEGDGFRSKLTEGIGRVVNPTGDKLECTFHFGPFVLDPRERTFNQNGELIHLQPKAFDVLITLVQRHGRLLGKQEILDEVWGNAVVTENSLARCVRQLRVALGDDAESPTYIQTVPGTGYRFIATLSDPGARLASTLAQTEMPDAAQAETGVGRHRPWIVGAGVMLMLLAAMLLTWFSQPPAEVAPATATQAPELAREVRLTVLPIEALGSNAVATDFAAGLTEEVRAHIALLDRVQLLANGSASEEDFVLEGSMMTSDTVARVVVQVTQQTTGSLVFSHTLAHSIEDELQAQQAVASQIAAAVKLAVVLEDTRFLNALSYLDMKSLTRLTEVRQQLMDPVSASDPEHLAFLEALDASHPGRPEVLGLLAIAVLHRHPAGLQLDDLNEALRLADQAIELQPGNPDARYARSLAQLRLPQSRARGLAELEQLAQQFPGESEYQYQHLQQLMARYEPCDQLALLPSVDPGAPLTTILAEIKALCRKDSVDKRQALSYDLRPQSLTTWRWQPAERLSQVSFALGLRSDPVQWRQYAAAMFEIGADDRVEQAINWFRAATGAVPPDLAMMGFLLGLESSELNAHALTEGKNLTDLLVSRTLLKSAVLPGAKRALAERLRQMPRFEISISNLEDSISLILLQHHVGEADRATRHAQVLLDMLRHYSKAHPASFSFYCDLQRAQLISAVVAGSPPPNMTPESYPGCLKWHGLLAPWSHYPAVQQLAQRDALLQQTLISQLTPPAASPPLQFKN